MSIEKFDNLTVFITGSCGTIGKEIIRILISETSASVVAVDNNETELFFQQEKYKSGDRVRCFLVDIRDKEALLLRMQGADIVLHTAALKHVGICEVSPNQAIQTNIIGTQNVIDAALLNSVERLIFTSSDKAVNPTNVMGVSKLMGERLVTSASENLVSGGTIFASTRFGNVLGSRGSVVPIFRSQIESGQPITLTDKKMTRFIMTLSEATRLVLDSVWIARGGEVMITKMPIAKIEDIAKVMAKNLAKEKETDIIEIGSKPGEKMYEELMNDEELRRSRIFGSFLIVLPAFSDPLDARFKHLANCDFPDRPYNSDNEVSLDESEVERYFLEHGILS
jgi:FlaA1/EpsC-like NDP-sugar epimerase